MLLQILVLVAGIWTLIVWYKNADKRRLYNQFKNDLIWLPFIGHAWYMNGSDRVIANPDDCDVVLKTSLEKDVNTHVTRKLLGNGSIFAPVSIWRRRRKMNLINFSQKKIQQFMKINSKQSVALVDQLKRKMGTGDLSMYDHIAYYSFTSICENAFGVTFNNEEEIKRFLTMSDRHTMLVSARLVPWLNNDFLYSFMPSYNEFTTTAEYLKNFTKQLIAKKMEENSKIYTQRKKNCDIAEENGYSMLDTFIQDSGEKRASHVEIEEEMLAILISSIDTTAIVSSFVLLLLSHYQNVQEKLYRELTQYFGDSSRRITLEDLPNLKFLDAVLKESMRLYPPVPIVIRQVKEKYILPSGITLIPGVSVIIHIWGLHRNKKYWGEDADYFKPERFLREDTKHTAAFIPFSKGPRNCLGFRYGISSAKIAVAEILRRYRTVPHDGVFITANENNPNLLPTKYDILQKHCNDFRIQLEDRFIRD